MDMIPKDERRIGWQQLACSSCGLVYQVLTYIGDPVFTCITCRELEEMG